MKAAAYNAAAGKAKRPKEAVLPEMINRFGVQAIFGRNILTAGEIIRMNYCENIANAYKARAQPEGWVDWMKKNPDVIRAFKEAEKIANGRID